MNTFTHWSDRVLCVPLVDKTKQQRPGFKPDGLWVSDETQEESWSNFCTHEAEWSHRLVYRYHVLVDTSRMCVITNAAELREFTIAYGTPLAPHLSMRTILWDRVAERYAGVLITPYIWECRLGLLELSWYYGWDVASGCIWDPRAIVSVVPA